MGYTEQNKEALSQFIREPLSQSNHRKFGKNNNTWLCIQRNLTSIKRDVQHWSQNPSFATIVLVLMQALSCKEGVVLVTSVGVDV